MSDLVGRLRDGSGYPPFGSYDYEGVDKAMSEAAFRITALENACRAYLEAYDTATGTVYVEPIIRAAMEENNSATQ